MVAAKSTAFSAIDLFTDPTHIQKARAEFGTKREPEFRLLDEARRSEAGVGLSQVKGARFRRPCWTIHDPADRRL
jgi:hypothetical protein